MTTQGVTSFDGVQNLIPLLSRKVTRHTCYSAKGTLPKQTKLTKQHFVTFDLRSWFQVKWLSKLNVTRHPLTQLVAGYTSSVTQKHEI